METTFKRGGSKPFFKSWLFMRHFYLNLASLLCQYFFLAQGRRQSERGSIDKLYDIVSDKCNTAQGEKMQQKSGGYGWT